VAGTRSLMPIMVVLPPAEKPWDSYATNSGSAAFSDLLE
jgi:hypothetical protein